MTSIYLIRHGQASFGEVNYDRLSATGIEQAKLLGKQWRSHDISSQVREIQNHIFTGNLERQIHTSAHFASFANVQADSNIIPELNEFDHQDILLTSEPKWENLGQVSQHFTRDDASLAELGRAFHLATMRWTSQKHCDEYNESWSQFKTRCVNAINQIAEIMSDIPTKDQDGANEALVFTSGGVISVVLQHLLQLSDEHCLKMMNQIRNTSVTKLVLRKSGLTLDYFNNYQHLLTTDGRLLTYR